MISWKINLLFIAPQFFPSFILNHFPCNSEESIYSFCSYVVQLIHSEGQKKFLEVFEIQIETNIEI